MKKGFSTLFVVIILGSIALSLAVSISTSSLWSVQSSILTKQENKARSVANACAEVALEAMKQNNSYTGSDTVSLGGENCDYTVTNTGGNSREISVVAVVDNVTRKLEITTDSFNPLNINSWKEIP